MRKKAALFLALCLLLCILPVTVSANGPVPANYFDIQLTGLPEGTAYVDLLIPLEETDKQYTDLVEGNLPEGFPRDAQILSYCDDGFRSYTFHYKGALSAISADRQSVLFCENDIDSGNYLYSHYDDIEARGEIRLAMLDNEGNILQVSAVYKMTQTGRFRFVDGYYYYDATTDQWDADTTVSGSGIFLYLILSGLGLLMTCGVEWLAAVPFGLRGRTVLAVNAVSQLLMRAAALLLYGAFCKSYTLVLLLTEIPVYGGEYMVYRRRMTDLPRWKVAVYTVVANTLSLVLGYRLNQILFA